jgi:hypothetical protein
MIPDVHLLSSSGADETATTIHDHIRAHLNGDGAGLTGTGQTLPDEAPGQGIRWAPGAADGVGTHHVAPAEPGEAVDTVYEALRHCAARKDSDQTWQELYSTLRAHRPLPLLDPLTERLRQSPLPASRLREIGVKLATTAVHREPVKYGISLIGLAGGPEDRELLHLLGRHEEFTLYCAVALARTCPDRDGELWRLAKQVTGWGRIDLVERLQDTDRPEIRRWILVDGFRNDVMYEYLACLAAVTGGLADALAEDPDEAVVSAACDLVTALTSVDGPGEDIDDYPDGPRAVALLVTHLDKHATDPLHLLTIRDLQVWLADERGDWAAREQRGWLPALRENLTAACARIRSHDRWPASVRAGLASDDVREFRNASAAAELLGISNADAHWKRIRADPLNASSWYTVMRSADETSIDGILAYAETALPLDEITTGAEDSVALGADYSAHWVLGLVVQELGGFPGKGWPLLAASLRSPGIRNRNQALAVLRTWGRAHWPAEAEPALTAALAAEPLEEIQERIRQLIRPDDREPPD